MQGKLLTEPYCRNEMDYIMHQIYANMDNIEINNQIKGYSEYFAGG